MDFIFYDLGLLVAFAIFVSVFLYIGKKNLQKDGLLLLYRTSWGIKLIDFIGGKYKRTLKVLSYVSIGLGYCLMAAMIWLFYSIIKIYMFRPDVVTAVKVPPIMPLIPYIDKIVPGLPSFYFIYWIIILAVIAITHEFAHGIFAAANKVRIKKTGFGFFPFFLPVFLAAFVELDEDQMEKKSKFSQMAVLSAGTFANVITAVIGFVILFSFFSLSFAPAGVTFDTYPYAVVGTEYVSSVNGIVLNNPTYENILENFEEGKLNAIGIGEDVYDNGVRGFNQDKEGKYYIQLYYESPAMSAGLDGAILSIDGVQTDSVEILRDELSKKSPGEVIEVVSFDGESEIVQEITLTANPVDENVAWLGIGFENRQREGVMGKIYTWMSSFKEANVYYASKIGNLGLFIYNLLWWVVLISLSVALVNMLPVGIFDGGRFFYLTVWGITGKEKWAQKAFGFMTYLFLALLLGLMILWAISFF
jgi:membrane-associated protease RseP (regulator of RpoE activity)